MPNIDIKQMKEMSTALGFRDHELPPELLKVKSTPVPQRPKQRQVPMKVLVLGLPRTSTSSMREALYQLGYADVHHMRAMTENTPGEAEMFAEMGRRKFVEGGKAFDNGEFDQLLGYCEAVSDWPCSAFAEELVAAYPDAKVVLTVRDSPEAWHKSVLESVWAVHQAQWYSQPGIVASIQKMIYGIPPIGVMHETLMANIWGGANEFPKNGKQKYIEHNELVKRIVPPDNLLVFNAKQGWEPLCKFLGHPVPETEYPRVNDGALFKQMVGKLVATEKSSTQTIAWWTIAAAAAGCSAFYGLRYYKIT